MTPEYIGRLLFRYNRKELSVKEERALAAWRGISPANERIFQEQTDTENLLRQLAHIYESRDRVFKTIQERYPFAVDNPRAGHSLTYRIVRIAAILVVVMGVGLYFIMQATRGGKTNISKADHLDLFFDADGGATAMDDIHRGWLAGYAGIKSYEDVHGNLIYTVADRPRAKPDKYYKLLAARNGKLCVRFPDSSIVWLNSGSTIRYPANFFHASAEMMIEGEAYFEVGKHAKKALPVLFRGLRVEAAGARFNVKVYPADSVISVTVLEGSLHLNDDAGTGGRLSDVTLAPGEQLRVVGDSVNILKDVDEHSVIEWMKGKLR